MLKRALIMLVLAGVLFGAVFGAIKAKNQYIAKLVAAYQPPPMTVSALPAEQQQWRQYARSIGTLYASEGVELKMEVDGVIKAIHFDAGQWVKPGQLLLELDDGLQQARLRSLQAQLRLARINYERDKKLLARRAISQTEFDTVEAMLKQNIAEVERIKAEIEQKKLYAPFGGKLGLPRLNIGQFLQSGEEIVTLQNTRKLFVDFSLPEKYLPVLSAGQGVELSVDTLEHITFSGEVSAVNAKVDLNTRNVLLRAKVDTDEQLLPGMFVDVAVIIRDQRPVVVVPQTAISFSLFGDSVFMVRANSEQAASELSEEQARVEGQVEGKDQQQASSEPSTKLIVERVYVKVGQRQGKWAEIIEGVNAGDQVVISGQLKLNNGSHVIIDNSIKL